MDQPILPLGYSRPAPVPLIEQKGVVYTKPWVVELLLDLAGYTAHANLVDALAVEPAAGDGAFLVRMAERLIASCAKLGRPFTACESSLIAYEIDEASAAGARSAVVKALAAAGVSKATAEKLASSWVQVGDYLFDSARLSRADFVIGNPPYIRLEDIPPQTAGLYRKAYPTMRGRADVYVAFFEAGLRQLKAQGVCAYICADRWMLNQYGAELRRLVTEGFGVETVVEMHNANPFVDDVSAYPAITVIRRAPQGRAVVASADQDVESASGGFLALALKSAAAGNAGHAIAGLKTAVVESWFTGADPWPCSSPARLALLRRLEDRFEPLESEATGTKVGIGVATGLDKVFITKDPKLVEESRLLPLAMADDTVTGHFRWAGHYLVNPWDSDGLVDLKDFPRLRAYLEKNEEAIRKRNTAQRNVNGWYRTIDRVNLSLTERPKLYINDIKNVFNPVIDSTETYPHHNLYFVLSDAWDLEVLGGLLLSSIGQFFIESYGVRMRGGYLRFQAQYLRRVHVPRPDSISPVQSRQLVQAFRQRDRQLATRLAAEIYGVGASEMEDAYQG
jgi:adenine-specific DNA-methyltransferase